MKEFKKIAKITGVITIMAATIQFWFPVVCLLGIAIMVVLLPVIAMAQLFNIHTAIDE